MRVDVWTSRPLEADGPSTLWLVLADASGLDVIAPFDGLGLRGNASSPVMARAMRVPASAMLGPDGGGLDVALAHVLPWFQVLSASCSIGCCDAALAKALGHLTSARLEHLDQTLADQAVPRARYGRARVLADAAAALVDDACAALSSGREDAPLRMLEAKAIAGEAALDVTAVAMRLGGGAAFRRDIGVQRHFRDAQGHERHGADDRRPSRHDRPCPLRHAAALGGPRDAGDIRYVLYSNYERQVDDLLAGRIDVAWNSPLAWVRSRPLASAAGRSASAPVMRDTDQDLTSVVLVRSDAGLDGVGDLEGRTVAVGALDSPQSRLIPLGHLARPGWRRRWRSTSAGST